MASNRLANAIKHTLAKRAAKQRANNIGISNVTPEINNSFNNVGSTEQAINPIPNLSVNSIAPAKPVNQIDEDKDRNEDSETVKAASLGISRNDQFQMPSDAAKEGTATLADGIEGFVSGITKGSPKLSRIDEFSNQSSDSTNEIKSGIDGFMASYAQAAPVARNDNWKPDDEAKQNIKNLANNAKGFVEQGQPVSREQNDIAISNSGVRRDAWSDSIADIASDPGNLGEKLFGTGGILDPGRKVTIDDEGIHRESGEETQAREQERIDESRGKFRSNIMDDPEVKEYLDEYQEIFKNEPQYDRESKDFWELLREDRLDNGSGNAESQITNEMTGDQYIKYRNAGVPGRPIEEINPDQSYSKMDEYSNYGFIPYVPDQNALNGMSLQNIEAGPSQFFNELSNLRENLFPYQTTINGKTINSSDFDPRAANAYLRKVEDEMNNPESAYLDPNANHEGMIGYTPSGYSITYSDGTSETFPGGGYQIIKQPTMSYGENGELVMVDPTIAVEFRDGSVIQFDDKEDYDNSMRVLDYRPSEEGESEIYWLPNFATGDGTELTYPEVFAIARDQDVEDTSDGITYDMNIGGIGTPNRLLKGITEGGNIPANFWNIAASSAPYLYWPTSIMRAGSDASVALAGNAPMETNQQGVGSQIAENPNADQYLSNIAFNAAMPVTELIAGGIMGNGPFKPFIDPRNVIRRKVGGTAAEPLAIAAADIVGEGGEEIIGNAFEEAANSGVLGWYANDMVDENGVPIYDRTGHVVKDYSTSLQPRLRNYVGEWPEAFVGGALLGGAHRVPQIIRSDIPETGRRMIDNRYARQNGLLPYQQVTDNEVQFVLPDSLIARYEREGDR